jgi:hypothetical protein
VLTYVRRNLHWCYSCSLSILRAWEHWVDSLIYCTLKCDLSLVINLGYLAPVTYGKVRRWVRGRVLIPLHIDLLSPWSLLLHLLLSHLIKIEVVYRLFVVAHTSLHWGKGREQRLLLETGCCLLVLSWKESHLLRKGESQVCWSRRHLIIEVIQYCWLSGECWMVMGVVGYFWFVVLVSCRLEGVATNLSLKSHCEVFEFIL